MINKRIPDEAISMITASFGQRTIAPSKVTQNKRIELIFTQIGKLLDIPIEVPADLSEDLTGKEKLMDISKHNNLFLREIKLSGDWWHQDLGPLIAFSDDQ